MKSVLPLVKIKHGSHLYGTSTPESDQDFKGVHIPSGRAILLGRAEDHISENVVAKLGTKNTSEAIDSDSYSVQKFFDMLMKGDTVATEILFAPAPVELGTETWWWDVRQTGLKLLNRQCKGFVGYCVRQAAKYGIKGSRMNAVKLLLSELQRWQGVYGGPLKLGEMMGKITEGEHTFFENIPHPDGRPCMHVVCCDRKMPGTVLVTEAIKVYQKVWDNYGERARAAMTNEGIDWKAMSHAVRVANQAIELLETGHITFPRPEADALLLIKQGQWKYDAVSAILEERVQMVHEASARSQLPEESNRELADQMVLELYRKQL